MRRSGYPEVVRDGVVGERDDGEPWVERDRGGEHAGVADVEVLESAYRLVELTERCGTSSDGGREIDLALSQRSRVGARLVDGGGVSLKR